MQGATVSAKYVEILFEGAINKGVDPREILTQLSIPVEILHQPKLRISTLDFANLCKTLSETMADEAYGLLATPQRPGSFKVAASTSSLSATVADSLECWANTQNLLGHSIKASTHITEQGGYLAVDCQPAEGVHGHYMTDTALTTAHRYHCWLAQEYLPLKRVELSFPEPSFSEEYRFLFYGVPVLFNQERNAIHFSASDLGLLNNRDGAAHLKLIENPFKSLLTQPRQSQSPSMKIRLWMERIFREGEGIPHLTPAAEYMQCSPQTLRRSLSKEGYTFQELKEESRRDYAIHLINSQDHSIEEIAFRLAYSDAGTFIRAFKHWTGTTPLAYRKLYAG